MIQLKTAVYFICVHGHYIVPRMNCATVKTTFITSLSPAPSNRTDKDKQRWTEIEQDQVQIYKCEALLQYLYQGSVLIPGTPGTLFESQILFEL